MTRFADSVKGSSAELSVAQLLQQPISELLGVSPDATTQLRDLGIETIFDLGSSSLFARAASALAASRTGQGLLPSDVLDASSPAVPATALSDLPIKQLRGISASKAKELESALHVVTIRELALWPPRQLARRLVNIAAGGSDTDESEASAEALRPRLGEYPTERVYYDTLFMLGTGQGGNLAPFSQPLALDDLTDSAIGFGAPAVGALATYSQSWFAQGVTLGHMVHSLALAPGEATRVAVIDWARRTSATVAESIEEREELDNSMLHARAVSEVQNAVADEMQYGGSIATGWAKSTSSGSGLAGSVGGGIAGTIGEAAGVLGFGFGGSTASQESETNSEARSTSWSVGSRSVFAEMSQRVNDRTEQHSTSVRNRRASAVREVSQSEHEAVSTRIVANYNHMHALTVQYYEVVQVYRVAVQLHKFDRVLFLPFKLLDFSGTNAGKLVARFRSQLLAASLTRRAASLLLDDRGRIEVRGGIRVSLPLNVGAAVVSTNVSATMARMSATPVADTDSPAVATTSAGDGGTVRVTRTVVRPGPIAEVLPGDARLVAISFEDVGIARVRVDVAGVPAETNTFVVPSATDQIDFTSEILLRTVEGVHVARDASTQSQGSMVLRYESEGRQSIAVVPLSLGGGDRMQKVAFFAADAADRRAELHAHLQANRGYYTRAVLERLDSASLVLLLSGVSWQGKPLADQVEPHPIAVTGNFIVLKAPAEPRDPSGLAGNLSWADLMRDRGVDFAAQDARLVPIPTGGVFAEAVLGRSNSAEKLDITRFWNWQDSPIPLQPPEISPVSTGSRAIAEDLRPGQLGAPVLNLVTPAPTPDPAGLAAVLGAIANGNMFRDMSGLAGTQATAQAASAGTLTAATEAGRIASENFKAATTQATEMGKAAADMWKVMKQSGKGGSGGGGSGGGSSAGISGEGARINQGRDLDQRGVSGQAGAGDGSATRITETHPVFAAASHKEKPQIETFSRELAYSDESAAASPHMLRATTAALGSPAAAGGVIASVGSQAMDVLQALVDGLILGVVRSDASTAAVTLQGVDLLPMRLHDNHVEFEQVGFSAWTNSSKHVYVNIPWFIQQYKDLVNSNTPPDDAVRAARAMSVAVMRHEDQHVTQFRNNGDQPPATFKDMIAFEAQAYAADIVWIQSPAAKTFMLNVIRTSQGILTQLENSFRSTRDEFNNWNSNLSDEASRKAAMIQASFLPATIRGTANYAIGDLYQTKAP